MAKKVKGREARACIDRETASDRLARLDRSTLSFIDSTSFALTSRPQTQHKHFFRGCWASCTKVQASLRHWCEVLDHFWRDAMCMTSEQQERILTPIARETSGQPRTYRLSRTLARDAAYRRLAITVLGLDVPTLASQLRSVRRALGEPSRTSVLARAA